MSQVYLAIIWSYGAVATDKYRPKI